MSPKRVTLVKTDFKMKTFELQSCADNKETKALRPQIAKLSVNV